MIETENFGSNPLHPRRQVNFNPLRLSPFSAWWVTHNVATLITFCKCHKYPETGNFRRWLNAATISGRSGKRESSPLLLFSLILVVVNLRLQTTNEIPSLGRVRVATGLPQSWHSFIVWTSSVSLIHPVLALLSFQVSPGRHHDTGCGLKR